MCFLKIPAAALTQYTSVEFYTRSNVSIPSSDIQTDITSRKRLKQTIGDDKVPFLIGWEDLFGITGDK